MIRFAGVHRHGELMSKPQKQIVYPFVPKGRKYLYVDANNRFMSIAKEFARSDSLDSLMPGAAVVAKVDLILGIGANGSDYHKNNECQRKILGCKTGEGYDLCEGCHPRNRSEPTAIRAALHSFRAEFVRGSDLYLWGHWWCCEPCWDAMIAAGIGNVYLLEDSEILFNKEHEDNIVGRQFD